MAQSDVAVTQSYGTMMQSDASEAGCEYALSDHQSLASGAVLKIGDCVRIQGLKAAHLNDLLATVDKFVEAGAAAGRWEVKIPDGSIKAIKPEHLALLPEVELGDTWGGDTDADVVGEEGSTSESHDE